MSGKTSQPANDSANDNTVFKTNTLPPSWTLKLTETWGLPKNNQWREEPPCLPSLRSWPDQLASTVVFGGRAV